MNLFYTICRALVWLPAKIIYPTKVINKKALPKKRKMIVVSNHLSWTDVLLVCINIPRYRHLLGKKELGKNPIARFFAFLLGVILIDRNKLDMQAMRKCIDKLKNNHGLMMFPEGTRNKNGDQLQPIKQGVVMFSSKSDAPIVPIMIDRKAKPFRKTYLYVGESFTLGSSGSKMLSSAQMAEGTATVEAKMNEAYLELKRLVAERNQKKNKKKNKQKVDNNQINVETKNNEEITVAEKQDENQ